jgi:hypothetical protein
LVERIAVSTSATGAELSAAAEIVGRYRRRVGELAIAHLGDERDDLVSAIHEAERALRTAERALQRAERVAAS